MKQITLTGELQDVPGHPGWHMLYTERGIVMVVDPQGCDRGCWQGSQRECEAFVEGWLRGRLARG